MSWLKKARNWGQIPFADPTEGWDDPYSRQHPDNPRDRRKKDLFQGSLGFGSETHNPSEESGNGVNLNQIDSLTSGYQIENDFYGGEVMEETPTGETVPRTDFQGDSGDSPSVLGNEDDESGSFILRYNPADRKPQEQKIKNFLRFQDRPHKKTRFNNQDINIGD